MKNTCYSDSCSVVIPPRAQNRAFQADGDVGALINARFYVLDRMAEAYFVATRPLCQPEAVRVCEDDGLLAAAADMP